MAAPVAPLEAEDTLRLSGFQGGFRRNRPDQEAQQYISIAKHFNAEDEVVQPESANPGSEGSLLSGEQNGFDLKSWSLLHPPERLFDLDASRLELRELLNNESGIGEIWVGQLTEPSGVHRVAVKRCRVPKHASTCA